MYNFVGQYDVFGQAPCRLIDGASSYWQLSWLCLLNRTDCYEWMGQTNLWLFAH